VRHRDRGLPVHLHAQLAELAALAADVECGVLSKHGRDTRGDKTLAQSDRVIVDHDVAHVFTSHIH
jgi:hypothetical protein